MVGEESAYAALGLRPGARRAEVDEAYRRLIKRYHPDVAGGDSGKAAEINRAYTQLRRQGAATSPRQPRRVPVPVRAQRPARGRRAGLVLVGTAAIVVAIAMADDVPGRRSGQISRAIPFDWSGPLSTNSVAGSPLADFEEPLQTAVIDRAIADAVTFNSQGDSAAMAEYSRACYNSLRQDPSLTWFDSCAAFDEATVTLSGEILFAESGPFDASSVVARQMGAARLLSHDTLAADSRLHQIKSRVELTLVPRMDEAAGQLP